MDTSLSACLTKIRLDKKISVLKDVLSMQNPNQYWSFCIWIKSNSGNVDQFHEFESLTPSFP